MKTAESLMELADIFAGAYRVYGPEDSRAVDARTTLLTALREALAEQPPQQEPVAWVLYFTNEHGQPMREVFFSKGNLERHAQYNETVRGLKCRVQALHIPTSPPQRQPLTEAEVDAGRRAPWGEVLDPFTAGVRFAEARLGITKGEA